MVLGLAAPLLSYGAYRDADAAQPHVLVNSFQRKAVGGFLALTGTVELVAVDTDIPQLTAGGFRRAGVHTQVTFAAPAFVDRGMQRL